MTRITFGSNLTAADSERRIIAGRIVTWSEIGHTSAGPTRFDAGSIELADDIRLLREHDHTSPLGRSVSVREHEAGIDARFRIAGTSAGNDALIEAAENLRDGLSVGVEVLESHDDEGVLVVTAARLDEVSLVAHPAINSARVDRVAASEASPEAEPEGEPMNPDETVEGVEESEAVESVEASRPRTVAASRRVEPFGSAEEYLIASIHAQRGDRDALARVTAAVAQEGTADNLGIVPTPIVGDLISKIYGNRPLINSARRLPMPQGGKVFERPMIAQHTTVGAQGAEFAELASQKMSITGVSVTKATYGGAVDISFQNRDWTDPAIMGIVVADLVRQYAEQTEAVAAITLTANALGSQDLTAAGGAAEVTAAIYDGAAKVNTAAGELPDTLYVSPDQWARLGKLSDTTGRPLFPNLAPSNAPGQMDAASFASNPFGLRLVVSSHLGAGTMILGVGRLFEHYEQVGGQLSATNVSTLSTTVAYYGYAAELVTIGGAFVKMTNA